jgi:hypothetical protein
MRVLGSLCAHACAPVCILGMHSENGILPSVVMLTIRTVTRRQTGPSRLVLLSPVALCRAHQPPQQQQLSALLNRRPGHPHRVRRCFATENSESCTRVSQGLKQ